jgi:hypothetical protein
MPALSSEENAINTRQLCFFAAFLLPVFKLLNAPSELAKYAAGDLIWLALAQYLLQGLAVAALLFLTSKSNKGFFGLLAECLGAAAARVAYILYALFFVFASLLPLLDLEKFVYAAFFDTAPSMCIFLPFFFLSGFISAKHLKALGRCADLAMPLFIVAYIGLMTLSVGSADFTNLLPFFSSPRAVAKGMPNTFGAFFDAALFLPLLGNFHYKKGDGKKVMLSYALGGAFVLFFLAVFYGIFGVIAPVQKNAFMQTAKYFFALPVIGRFDLLLGYLMTIVLLFYSCIPLQLSVHCFAEGINTEHKTLLSALLNIALLLFALFCSRYYTELELFIDRLFWIFPLFSFLIPILSLLLLLKKPKEEKSKGQGRDERKNTTPNKESSYAQ